MGNGQSDCRGARIVDGRGREGHRQASALGMTDVPKEDSPADAPLRWWSVALVVDEADSRPLSRQEIFDVMPPEGIRRISIGPSGLDEPEEVASLKLELQASSATAAQ